MKIFTQLLGNYHTDPHWKEKLQGATLEYITLNQWDAQKSRLIGESNQGTIYGIILKRRSKIEDGAILEYDPQQHKAVVIRLTLQPVLVIELRRLLQNKPETIMRQSIEIGHALGNQHWPTVIKGNKLYVPLTVDQKVMQSVLETHQFEQISYEFQTGEEVIPFLAPHEIRQLFGGASQPHTHIHAPHE